MLLDSNVIIHAAKPEREDLRHLIEEKAPAVSVISYIEVLGYHDLGAEKSFLEQFFDAAEVLPLSTDVVQKAIRLRQRRNISLGDSIIAATAIVHDLRLLTHNPEDFRGIPRLRLIDPV